MKRFSDILLLADEARENSVALKRAIDLARSNHATLTIVDVVGSVSDSVLAAITAVAPAELFDFAIAQKRSELDAIVAAAQADGVQIASDVLVGKTFLEVVRRVLRHGHDLVIKSIEPKSKLRNWRLGSTDMHLLRKCPCPVWITKSNEQTRYRNIVAAVDNDPDEAATESLNRQIVEMSTSLAVAEAAELHIVHAWELAFESYWRSPRTGMSAADIDAMVADEATARERWLRDLVAKHSNAGNKGAIDYLSPRLHLLKGDANDVVPKMARQLGADLVVMGTVARTGIPGFIMGNTAESILTSLDCSVLTVKPPGFVSPVTVDA